MVCSCRKCASPGFRDTFAAISSDIKSKTECPPTPKTDEPGKTVSSCLIMGLRSAADVGDDEWYVKLGMKLHSVSYVQLRPVILSGEEAMQWK